MKTLKHSFLLVIVLLLFSASYNSYAKDSIDTKNSIPMDIPLLISGNYGDVRSNSFHFGIDFRTQDRTGLPVHSISDGYVARVKVEPGGYGKAIYIKHNNGKMSVYAHLDRFTNDIEEYIKEEQYAKKSFYQDIIFIDKKFVVGKSQIIGYSGNSGHSTGPHLHFEIRDYQTQNTLNGLIGAFPIVDTIFPEINRIWVYNNFNYLNANELSKSSYKVVKNKMNYVLAQNRVVMVPSSFYMGIDAFDNVTDAGRKLSFYSAQLYLDTSLVFKIVFDEMQFDQNASVNALIDYKHKIQTKESIYHLFLFPNQELLSVKMAANNGFISLSDSLIHDMKIIVADFSGNKSEINFKVRSNNKLPANQTIDSTQYLLSYNKENTIQNNIVKAVFPSMCLYSDVSIDIKEIQTKTKLLSKAVVLGDKSIPVKKPFKMYFSTEGFHDSIKSKLLVVNIEEDSDKVSIGGELQNKSIVASTKYFGVFGLDIDTLPPGVVALNISNNKNMNMEKSIRVRIKDELSGIGEYNGYIDNNWVLFEYEQKSNSLTYFFDRKRFVNNGKNHLLKIVVSDKRNNKSTLELSFTR